MFEYVLDTFGEGSSLYDKQCDEFRLIGIARTKFGEVHILVEKVFFQFLDIRYFSNCDDGEAAEVGIDDNGLCICVADNAYAGIAFKFIKLSFKLGSEICTFQIVNGANKSFLLTISRESAPLVPKCEL